jgi:signal recognition particle subunit SRP54
MRDVRMALLEADVNFKVVKDFVKKVKERAIGQEVLETLTPAQVVIKIVNEELTALMGGTQSKLNISSVPPTIIMMVGLQGAGKTTTAGKLALSLRKQGKHPLLVADDIYRPAAVKQLEVLGKQLDIPVFSMEAGTDAVTIAKESVPYANSHAADVIIIDTAGRLHINEELMQELTSIKSEVKPHEILLVVDAMTGQDAVNVAESFNGSLGLDGIVMTKMDGDARGGAALSVKAVQDAQSNLSVWVKNSKHLSRFIRIEWLPEFWVWAMCFLLLRRLRMFMTSKQPKRWKRSCVKTNLR